MEVEKQGKQVGSSRLHVVSASVVLLIFAAGAAQTLGYGGDRKIVFECPCSAEFTSEGNGEGTLVLRFGVRSFRDARSAEVGLFFDDWLVAEGYSPDQPLDERHQPQGSLGDVAPNGVLSGLVQSYRIQEPRPGARLHIGLWEAKGERRDRSHRHTGEVTYHEWLSLWPVPSSGSSETVTYVDILNDQDGDGTGDVNERIVGTDPEDPASFPGVSTVDVLWLYQESLRLRTADFLAEYHHAAVVANSMFVDSGTNIRLRSVGFVGVEEGQVNEGGHVRQRVLDELMARHGADLMNFYYDVRDALPDPCGDGFIGGCADIGDGRTRGGFLSQGPVPQSNVSVLGASLIAHELGHVAGLAHSARQGEAHGSFRWSRGHYVGDWERFPTVLSSARGTIMSYGFNLPVAERFSNPASDWCEPLGRCGLPATHSEGADAASSLNLIRFQVAGRREPKPDSDGDGFVDVADSFPDDPSNWADRDGDGLGDNDDPDADGDGWANSDDLFPLDSREWADLDGDGLGDNADSDADGDGVANSEDLFPKDSLDWEDSDGDGVGDNAQNLHPFRDPGLRAIVEIELGKPAGAPISDEELAQLSALEDQNGSIKDLTGLELAKGLTRLVINVRPEGWRGTGGHGVSDLSPLAGLVDLQTVWLSADSRLSDLSPLAGLSNLTSLALVGGGNELTDQHRMKISDLSGIVGLPLTELRLINGRIADLSPVARLPDLTSLDLRDNRIEDVAALRGLAQISELNLGFNRLEDISSLAGLSRLEDLHLASNDIEDVSALANLTRLWSLTLNGNRIVDLSPLAELSQLVNLRVGENRVRDWRPLAGISELRVLGIGGNPLPVTDFLAQFTPGPQFYGLEMGEIGLSDLSPLADFMGRIGPRSWFLSLYDNPITDLGPLANRSLWDLDGPGIAYIGLGFAPLDRTSMDSHIPLLQSFGVQVGHHPPPAKPTYETVFIPDDVLRALISDATCGGLVLVDDEMSAARVSGLGHLYAYNRGIFDLTGLEAAANVRELHLGSNGVSNLAPLADLPLVVLDLHDNLVSDLSPLAGASSLQTLYLNRNPLTEESLNEHISALRDAGTKVEVDAVEWTVAAGGATETFDTSGYFASLLGSSTRFAVDSSNPSLASPDIVGGEVAVTPGPIEGRATVTVTATNSLEESATLKFDVAVARPREVPLFPAASEAMREGFLRVINRSVEAELVRIDATDGTGQQAPPVSLALGAGAAAHFNSGDLENGNAAKRLSGGAGAGIGDWRLSLLSRADISAPSYIRTSDGFVTTMHDVVPEANGEHRVATFNPGSNYRQASRLRLINPGREDADVTIRGLDDTGAAPGNPVRVTVKAGSDLALAADELESGTGLDGALRDGQGKWRLAVSSEQPLRVMSLMESPTGHLTNLSTVPTGEGGNYVVPLFPSASDALGRQGFMRVINNGDSAAEVRISAFDDTDWTYDPLTLTVPANGVTHVNSNDLELGNADKGLSGSTGAGQGHWRLELGSPADIDVLAYIRTKDGFLTSMHDLVPSEGNRHIVAFLNPGSNHRQVSRLRLINAGDAPARVKVTGIDSEGASPGDVVRLSLPAGAARSFTAAELENGAQGLTGALGDGASKWRLHVESDRPISVMSLLETPTGHLTNLSTEPDTVGGG